MIFLQINIFSRSHPRDPLTRDVWLLYFENEIDYDSQKNKGQQGNLFPSTLAYDFSIKISVHFKLIPQLTISKYTRQNQEIDCDYQKQRSILF